MSLKRCRSLGIGFCRDRPLIIDKGDLAVDDEIFPFREPDDKVRQVSVSSLIFYGNLRIVVFTTAQASQF